MSSNPLTMGYGTEGGDLLLAGTACGRLSGRCTEPVCAGYVGDWAVT